MGILGGVIRMWMGWWERIIPLRRMVDNQPPRCCVAGGNGREHRTRSKTLDRIAARVKMGSQGSRFPDELSDGYHT